MLILSIKAGDLVLISSIIYPIKLNDKEIIELRYFICKFWTNPVYKYEAVDEDLAEYLLIFFEKK